MFARTSSINADSRRYVNWNELKNEELVKRDDEEYVEERVSFEINICIRIFPLFSFMLRYLWLTVASSANASIDNIWKLKLIHTRVKIEVFPIMTPGRHWGLKV
jgi:hypothetical protein